MNKPVIRFYLKGRFIKNNIMSSENIKKAINFINSGGMVKIENKLINDVSYLSQIDLYYN